MTASSAAHYINIITFFCQDRGCIFINRKVIKLKVLCRRRPNESRYQNNSVSQSRKSKQFGESLALELANWNRSASSGGKMLSRIPISVLGLLRNAHNPRLNVRRQRSEKWFYLMRRLGAHLPLLCMSYCGLMIMRKTN